MAGIINLHHDIFGFLVFIGIFVFWFLFRIIWTFHQNRFSKPIELTHNTFIEVFWTVVPSLILVLIIIPSYILLYSLDFISSPYLTVKVIGKQ